MFRASLIRPVMVHVFSNEIILLRACRALSKENKINGMFNAASLFCNKVGSTHYGGLGEVGVKSVKHHLKRTFHTHTLTFEEFSTALAEIESYLNLCSSCPPNSDPEDSNILNLTYFLIGISTGIVLYTEPLQTSTDHLGCL
jgi:hypothetical protein